MSGAPSTDLALLLRLLWMVQASSSESDDAHEAACRLESSAADSLSTSGSAAASVVSLLAVE